jgi:hypothetical protein
LFARFAGDVNKLNKEKAIELIQVVKPALSRAQVDAMIAKKLGEFQHIVTEEGAVDMVLQDLGVGAPAAVSNVETFTQRKARLEAEPDKGGTFLKADKVAVGDLVKITVVALEEAKTIQTARGPVDIASRPQVTGLLKPKGGAAFGEEVKFSLTPSNEKSLYAMWGKPLDECVGMVMMVASIQRKKIGGNDAIWIVWTGLPAA